MNGRSIAVLGATGSIGKATLDVVKHLGPDWRIAAMSAHRGANSLAELAKEVSPSQVVLSGYESASELDANLQWPPDASVKLGPDGLIAAATSPDVDTVVAAIVGRAGVESTLAALRAGKRVALANKETLVCAGSIVEGIQAELAAKSMAIDPPVHAPESSVSRNGTSRPLVGDNLLPVDSEHSAIFQCLGNDFGQPLAPTRVATDGAASNPANVSVIPQATRFPPARLILTASGGPFRKWSYERMREATVEEALNHPTWNMGRKITIDSATMMNKALEIIEAKWLFGVSADALEVMVHPQSLIHSMVEFADGSVVAQLSPPDMRLPIQHALTYPDRFPCPAPKLERTKWWEFSLEPVDRARFPAIELGFEVAAAGGTAGSVLNAANEAAVDLFLDRKIRFTDIVPACRSVLEHHTFEARPSLERLLELDRWARAEVRRWTAISNC